MTDNKEVKMVNENMESDKETHNKDNGKVGTTTLLIGGAIGTITLKDTPKESETTLSKDIQEYYHHVTNGYNTELVVDDSEGSEGSIHELLQSEHGELDKDEVKFQNEDETTNVVDDPQLLEEEDKKPWKLEDEMTEAD